MKLLFDQNISPKIVKHLEESFPGSKQVRHLDLEDASDTEIFQFGRLHNFAIVTFDSDYVDLSVVKGAPPKIIWLKTGNLTTKSIAALMEENMLVVRNFLETPDSTILEIIR